MSSKQKDGKQRPLTSYFQPLETTTESSSSSSAAVVETVNEDHDGPPPSKNSNGTKRPVVSSSDDVSSKRPRPLRERSNEGPVDPETVDDIPRPTETTAITSSEQDDPEKPTEYVDEKEDTEASAKPRSVSLAQPGVVDSDNVVHLLESLSIHGRRRSIPAPPTTPWKAPSWIDLHLPLRVGVTALAWDDMGVLLAAHCTDYRIRIYDWDMVVAADMKGRNLRARRSASNNTDGSSGKAGCFVIEPILVFPFPSANVAIFEWNPYNPDQLIVGTRYVLIFRWISTSICIVRRLLTPLSFFPPRTYL